MNEDTQAKCREAIIYMLQRIQREPRLAWYMISTEAHARMLEAISEIDSITLADAEEKYYPKESEDPYEAGREKAINDAAECGDLDHQLGAAIIDERDPIVVDIRESDAIQDVFFSLNAALSENYAGRVEFMPNKFQGYHRITLIPS